MIDKTSMKFVLGFVTILIVSFIFFLGGAYLKSQKGQEATSATLVEK